MSESQAWNPLLLDEVQIYWEHGDLLKLSNELALAFKENHESFGVINLGSGKKKIIVKWVSKDPETLPASWMCSRLVLTVNMFPQRKESALPAIKMTPLYPVSLV